MIRQFCCAMLGFLLRFRSPVLICSFVALLAALPGFAKDKADLLVVHGTVVTMDAQRRVIDDGAVAILGDSIVAVGKSAEIESKYEAPKIIDARGGIIMPGLINGHAHAAMSLFRGIADDLPLDEWLKKYIFPAEARNVTEDFVVWATRLSLLEMLRGGTTTYCDMYYFEDAVARVTKEAGMRGVLAETIIDFPAPDNKTTQQAFDYTQKFLDHWTGDPLITAAVGPHSIYTLSEKTLQDSAALARRNHAPIAIHIAEAPFELQLSREKHGATPVAYLERIGLLGPDVIGAHCIWVDAADIAILTHFGVGCTHNPSSNMKTAAGVMPVVDMLAAGQAIGLATDGAASNNNQDMFEEMDLAAKLQKIARRDPARFARTTSSRDGDDRRRSRTALGKTDRLARSRQEGGLDPGRDRCAARHADVQRLLEPRLCPEVCGRENGHHQRQNRSRRSPHAYARRARNSRQSRRIQKEDRSFARSARRKIGQGSPPRQTISR